MIKRILRKRESKSLVSVFPELANFPLPTTGEVEAILTRYKADEKGADEELKHAFIRFVASVAKQYVGQGYSPEELLSFGMDGVLEAARNYELSSEVSFSRYVIPYIKQAIHDAVLHKK